MNKCQTLKVLLRLWPILLRSYTGVGSFYSINYLMIFFFFSISLFESMISSVLVNKITFFLSSRAGFFGAIRGKRFICWRYM